MFKFGNLDAKAQAAAGSGSGEVITKLALAALAVAAFWVVAGPEAYPDGSVGWVCPHGHWKGMGCTQGCG